MRTFLPKPRLAKIAAAVLSAQLLLSSMTLPAFAAAPDIYNAPAQIAVAMTEDPQHTVSVTWTTVDTALTGGKVIVNVGGADKEFTATKTVSNVSSSGMKKADNATVTQKAFYNATITGLEPGRTYSYTCQVSDGTSTYSSKEGSFKTAPAGDDEFTFVYLSDTQASGVNGKAITANASAFAKHNPEFVYIAGDLTDTAANENQWEMFFNQEGASGRNNSSAYVRNMSDYTIAAVQGNHDNNTLAGHMNYPAAGGTNITYAYTYGPAHFIMLNFESTATRAAQQAFLRAETAKAKEAGLWTIVGFHKSIYTGASHITDSDVIDARKYWSPIFAELDIDVVLQGHDHVLSRGFVKGDGTKADITQKLADGTYAASLPENAPLYYVGNCASTLKFYSLKNYTVASGDPVAPGYSFLDINSAQPVGHATNPTGPQTDVYQGPTYTTVHVKNDSITFNTYMFPYNTSSDAAGAEILYDTFTVTRDAKSSGFSLTTDAHLVNKGDYFRATASFAEEVESNAAIVSYKFDTAKYEYRGFTPAEGVTVIKTDETDDGMKLTLMITDYKTKSYGEALFSAKEDADLKNEDNSIEALVEYVVRDAAGTKSIQTASASTSFTSSGNGSGSGENGEYNLLDLSNLIDVFGMTSKHADWSEYRFFDFNNNGEIDIFDIATLASKIK